MSDTTCLAAEGAPDVDEPKIQRNAAFDVSPTTALQCPNCHEHFTIESYPFDRRPVAACPKQHRICFTCHERNSNCPTVNCNEVLQRPGIKWIDNGFVKILKN